MAKTRTIKFKQTVSAPLPEVYRAFTGSTAFRDWFCDAAQADPRKGGRLYLWWNSGYYTSGEFVTLTPGKKIVFTWRGRGEPEATRVQVSLAARNGGTVVTVAHTGVGTGKQWAEVIQQFERGWIVGLENLQSVLETGQDLRLVRRPMLGINVGEFNAEIAAQLGAPVTEGIRLNDVVKGMGAQAAGLQKDDVIVGIGGKKVTGGGSLANALQPHRAGDQVTVAFYRGGEKKTVKMELSRRPLPEIPPTQEVLAEAVRKMYADLDAEVALCFEGVSEAEASYQLAPGEWSAKETVAHFIVCERENHTLLTDLINGDVRWSDAAQNPTNVPARIGAIVAVHATVPAILEELKHNEAETVAMLAALPAELVARKGSYWQIGYNLLQAPDHVHEHLGQIRAAVEAARKQLT